MSKLNWDKANRRDSARTARSTTNAQRKLLAQLAREIGVPYYAPRYADEASAEIDRLIRVRRGR